MTQNVKYLVKIVGFLTVFLVFCSCITHQETSAGYPVFSEITPQKNSIYFYVRDDAPQWFLRDVRLSVLLWNQVVGTRRLEISSVKRAGNVEVVYSEDSRWNDHPGYTELLGCMTDFGSSINKLFTCRIQLNFPASTESFDDPEEMAKLTYLLKNVPLDAELFRAQEYSNVGKFLRDKWAVIATLHEIGHVLGLDHAASSRCIMAKEPQNLAFCSEEIEAARVQLALPPSFAFNLK